MNTLTKKKLNDILNLIVAGTNFNEILEKKFSNSLKKKNEWFNKNKSDFSNEEIQILSDFMNYEKEENTSVLQKITDDKIEESNTEVLPKITEKEEEYNSNTNVILNKFKDKNLEKKFIYLLDHIDEFLKIGEKLENELMIPKELLDLPSVIKTMRVSKEISDEFDEFCSNHKNYTKIQILNFVLKDFMERYK